ncbi:hypothetical protein [Mameliella sediminis]|uniref:hypothetical protein n=1 Tax=Mameliella sediminis TaxID=2836866 RepID=UPI001C439D98|nr:hypothetical protein [Mameliella sediminis]MBV7394542.1 hypothetical protein [Mameliella sediminis]
MTGRLRLVLAGAAGAVLLLVAVYALGGRAARLEVERDAARGRVETVKDATELHDETDDLARDGDALRRELDRRLSRPGPD